jgi:hypothetical protein
MASQEAKSAAVSLLALNDRRRAPSSGARELDGANFDSCSTG